MDWTVLLLVVLLMIKDSGSVLNSW
jgi:hypothetical protein